MVTQFGDGIFTASGPVVRTAGFRYPTRMVVMRLRDDRLFVWSPIALTGELGRELRELGQVGHVVAPNMLHDRYIPQWRSAYPKARFHAPAELRRKTEPDPFDETLRADGNPAWSADIEQTVFDRNILTTEFVFFHRRSRTAIFTDLIQNFDDDWFGGWRSLVAKLDLLTAPESTVPRKFRIAFTDRRATRKALDKVMEWPIENLIMAHGDPVRKNGRETIMRAFSWL